jgi:tetraacyldisaccharide 4'-kinase
MLLAKGLARSGHRVCILSRGYRRKIKRSPLVVSDGRSLVATVEEAGDEPYLLARRLPEVGVVVSSDRVGAARHAAGAFGPDIFLLDDGFQVRGVAKDVEIVTVDAGALESRQAPLPLGRLREGWGSIKPNHLAVVLLARRGSKPARKCVGRLRTDKVFYAAREDPTVVASDGSRVDSGAVGEVPVLVVSGIASPAGFEETCRQAGLDARVSVRADDHHWYDQDDVALLARLMAEYGCQRLVTTEKDAAKLPGRLLESAWVVRADVALEEPGAFWSELRKRLGEKG